MPSNPPKALPADRAQSSWLVFLVFFASGISGLIYQVVWVRAFGNVFGNTIHSASIVVAMFMLGLGVGSRLVGAWADERYSRQPGSLLRAYGRFEIVIALLGFAVSMIVPRLGQIGAVVSSYSQDSSGWYVPSVMTYGARIGISLALLLPVTILMGGTLTLLIRHLVRQDVSAAPARIAQLYAVNTAGAALGSLLTDFALVPAAGLLGTQMVAVALNLIAGAGALAVASRPDRQAVIRQPKKREPAPPRIDARAQHSSAVVLASVALGLAGFAGLGMEIVWFRHATILLGGFRAVFALLLTVVLGGIGLGAWAGGILARRTRYAAECLMVTQALFVLTAVTSILLADARPLETTARAAAGTVPLFTEIWFNARPLIQLAAVPSMLMGLGFPLANALVQQYEQLVARRAGVLYLANTVGAVCGSAAAGFVLLPWLGIQLGAAVLSGAAAMSLVPLYLLSRPRNGAIAAGSLFAAAAAIAACLVLPADFVIRRAVGSAPETQVLAQQEGLTEVITITETRDVRTLLTNGHAMSSTAPLSQRYMRALAHIPLLMMEDPASVLVIGFGVGNTTHAATLHPSVRRVEVADLSRGILEHATYFDEANHGVLTDSRVAVFVNDGRQHLQTRTEGAYDLITLEPPPISYAGVAALYSKEFYALARSRLAARGFVSQWLPTYQVPTATALSMIRAFIEVFPQAVLLSGAQADLLLIGTTGTTIELDPVRAAAALMNRPRVRDDLQRLDLGSVREIAGAFVGSARTLEAATGAVQPVTDDWPVMEHSVLSALNPGQDVPGAIVNIARLTDWCPQCFADGAPVQAAAGLDLYMRLIDLAYRASPSEGARVAASQSDVTPRRIAGSAYLGTIVPEGAELYNTVGLYNASQGALSEAIDAFRKALRLDPDSALSHWHLGAALAEAGARTEAIAHLQRSVDIDPTNRFARDDLNALLAARQIR